MSNSDLLEGRGEVWSVPLREAHKTVHLEINFHDVHYRPQMDLGREEESRTERDSHFPFSSLLYFSSLFRCPDHFHSRVAWPETSAVNHDKQSASLPFVSPLKTALMHE